MKRREFITLLGGAATATAILRPFAARAQPAGRVFRIGFVVTHSADSQRLRDACA
jgi:hypothetical protein